MEKGIDSYLKEQFEIPDVDIRTYSPLTLAYIGDGIYDLVIRSLVVAKGNTRASELHKRTSQIVKAHTQAEMMEVLLPILTAIVISALMNVVELHLAVRLFKVSRNELYIFVAACLFGVRALDSICRRMCRRTMVYTDYCKATGFEALMGYLYLKDEFERLVELVKTGVEEMRLKL